MEVSTSIADITPTQPVGNGRTAKGVKIESSRRTLEANIVTFLDQRGVPFSIVGLDSMVSSDHLEQLIESKLRDSAHKILIVASHTHHAPVLSPRLAENYDYDEKIVADTANQIARNINDTLSSFESIEQVKYGRSVVAGNVYRRKKTLYVRFKPRVDIGQEYAMAADRTVPVPQDLFIYVPEYTNGVAAFVIWSWTCHATTVAPTNCFSADFPGEIRDYLRKLFGNKLLPVIYLPGFCGDIRPDNSSFFTFSRARIRYPLARLFRTRGSWFFKELCDQLTTGVDDCLKASTTVTSSQAVSYKRVSVPTDAFFVGTGPHELGICRIKLAGLELLLIGAEVSYGFQKMLKAQLDTSESHEVLYSGLFGDVFGYFPTEKQVAEGGYEPDRSQSTYGISGVFRSNLNQRFVEMVKMLYK